MPSFSGTLRSPNCGLRLNVTAARAPAGDPGALRRKTLLYALLMSAVGVWQLVLLMRQMTYSATPAGAAKVSLASIAAQAIVDVYVCMLHLTIGVVFEPLFSSFAAIAFFKLILFSAFEMRYLLVIWKARRPQAFNQGGWLEMRRQLGLLYSRFYGCLVVGFFLTYQFRAHAQFLVLGAYSFWLPQAVTSALRDTGDPFSAQYLWGNTALRLVLPLYIWGCPRNLLRALPFGSFFNGVYSPTFCAVLAGWVFAQAALLEAQRRFGPRFFVPARFLPQKYDYRRPIPRGVLVSAGLVPDEGDDDSGGGSGSDGDGQRPTLDCVICMQPVVAREVDGGGGGGVSIQDFEDVSVFVTEDGRVGTNMMGEPYNIAPCGHVFHEACLQRWMAVKLECPTCRAALPTR